MTGLAIVLLPWLISSLIWLAEFIGPHGEGLRSNQSIMDALAADPQPSWQWRVLGDRIDAGQLGAADARRVVDDWIRRSEPGGGSDQIAWFFLPADRAGDISNAQYTSLARDFWGQSAVQIEVREVTSDHIDFNVKLNNVAKPLFAWCFEHAVGLADLSLVRDGDGATTRPARGWSGINPNNSTFEPVARRYQGRMAVTAPAGKYIAKFSFDTGVVLENNRNSMLSSLGARAGPPPGCIALSAAVPIEIPPAPPRGDSPAVTLVTDARYESAYTLGVKVTSATALCFSDATMFIVNLRYQNLPIIYFFSPTITVDGLSSDGTSSFLGQGTSFEPQIQFLLPAFIPKRAFAHIEFSADLAAVRQYGGGPCWGGNLSFSDVPFKVLRESGTLPAAFKWAKKK